MQESIGSSKGEGTSLGFYVLMGVMAFAFISIVIVLFFG
jgi:hypothetical protein